MAVSQKTSAPAATKRSFASPRTLRAPVAPTALFTLRQRTRLSGAMSSQKVDVLFQRALGRLPELLSLALKQAGLDDAVMWTATPATPSRSFLRQESLVWERLASTTVRTWLVAVVAFSTWWLRRKLLAWWLLVRSVLLCIVPCHCPLFCCRLLPSVSVVCPSTMSRVVRFTYKVHVDRFDRLTVTHEECFEFRK